ncbi:hypothetical protein LWF15_09680 [Kineosporia rhizophila]|uniref:hypothetical protein n=1 Tax=Kineosporia TaxID=49184 RepID=UPI001E295BA3|nr:MULTISPECIES: hypothetical protein [Kineosporia]MCE0535782.1 hypothetical protein [Kineosporia rhizophila]GLY18234.1 hypothetical protein Kisp01_52480 [Kineosporia sp. NBRC 101677]
MERPSLTTVLASVLTAAVENDNRPALLATVIPLPRRSPDQEQTDPDTPDPGSAA